MLSLLLALATSGLLALGLVGWRLARDPGVQAVSWGRSYESTAPAQQPRRNPVAMLLEGVDRIVGRVAVTRMGPASRASLRTAILRAGSPPGYSVESLIRRQATWAFLLGITAVVPLAYGIPYFLFLPVLGWFLPRLSLRSIAKKRWEQIERDLPDFLDILNVTVSAGVGFRAALRRVGRLVEGPIGEEIALTLRQIDLGATSRAAFGQIRERTTSPSMANFVTTLLQAEELGTPIGGFLESYAEDLRRTSGQRARAAAARANPKLSLVVTTVLTPSIVLLMLGTLILNVLGQR